MTDAFRLAEMVATAMAPYCDEPYAIFGHSMGAALAYETSLSVMRMNGRPPERLLVSAHRAPHLPSRKEPTYQLPDALFIEELRRLKGTPPAVFEHPELMDLMLPILRSDFQLANSYQAAAPTILPCPVIAFGGEDDPDAELSELRAWREVGTGPFRVHMLKGDHFFINSRHRELTSLVGQELAAVQR